MEGGFHRQSLPGSPLYMLPGMNHLFALNAPDDDSFVSFWRRLFLFFLIIHCTAGLSDPVPEQPSQPSNDYSVRIFSSSGEVQDWNLTPASVWIEVNFTRRVDLKTRQSSKFQVLRLPEESFTPVNLSWNRAGTFLRIIPLEPFQAGCDYELRIPKAKALNSDQHDGSTDSDSICRWTTQQNPPAVANGFVMSHKRLLPQPRAIQWTTFSFWSAHQALLTDSTGGIFVVDLHPISGEVLNTLEVARLADQVISATAIRPDPLESGYEFIFTTIPSRAFPTKSSGGDDPTPPQESRIETGTLHRWSFQVSDGTPGLEWTAREVLIENLPFIRSVHPGRPLGALECVDPSGILLGIDSISASLQNSPFDPDVMSRWEKASSSILEASLDKSRSRRLNFLDSDSENSAGDQYGFFATGIFNPSLMEHHSESGITIALSSGTGSSETYLAPEGPTSPSIQFQTPGRYLFRLQRDGYYGFPNRSRSEFVAFGGNPTPSADLWEEPAYPVGVLPLKSFQSEDIFQLPFSGTPISLTQIRQPHPLAGRFLIGVASNASGELRCLTMNRSGGYLNSNSIYGEDLQKLNLNCHWLQQRPGTAQIYALGSSGEDKDSTESGLWVMSPSTNQ